MKRVPKYVSFRIFLSSALLYFFLVIPFAGFMWIQKMPELLKINSGSINLQTDSLTTIKSLQDAQSDQKLMTEYDTQDVLIPNLFDNTFKAPNPVQEENRKSYISTSFDYLLNSFLISLALLALFSIPFKRFFHRKRKKYLSLKNSKITVENGF